MKIRIIYSLVFFIAFISQAESQSKIEKANTLYENLAYIDAIKIYESVANKGYKSVELFQRLGNAYYFNGEFTKANKWYTALFDLNQKIESEYYYRYSQTLKSVGDYPKADQILNEFIKTNSNDIRGRLYRENKNYLELIKEKSGQFVIESVKINSEFSDYGGAVNGNNLVFTSNRKSNLLSNNISEWTKQGFTKLYSSEINSDGSLGSPTEFSYSVESKFNESTPVFTKDGATMYFTGNSFKENKASNKSKKITRLRIFKATLKDGKWMNIVDLSINNDNYSTAHPALSPDEKTLYFVSDMPGSIGQSDIYEVEIKNNGRLGTPINLGNKINTEGKETFPSVSGDNELYFSSDGHPGLGGLDVFAANISDGNVVSVQNVGEPINSPMDDFGFIMDHKSKTGYFSSNRSGGAGYDDIYKLREIAQQKPEQILEGIITDGQTGNALFNSKVSLYDQDMKLVNEVFTDEKGSYVFRKLTAGKSYNVRAEKQDYLTKDKTIILPEEAGKNEISLSLDRALVTIGEGSDLAKALNNIVIYFDLNQSIIRPDAAVQLAIIAEVMKEFPTIKIDVRSYTDSRASKEHNFELSDARAKATIKWLKGQGIEASRLTGRGYGESQLLNGCSDGVKCTEDEHKINRRSEFIIVKI